ncbi:MAG: PD-(D/E)XK nuclease family protein [Pseudomonadota bacterium]
MPRGDNQPLSPTELAQLSRCEQQLLYDKAYGAKRSQHWQKRSAEGDAVHAKLHRAVTAPSRTRRGSMLIWLAVAALLLVLVLLAFGGRGSGDKDALLPTELQGAELIMSERSLVRKKPVHIRGRPDEVWQKNGRRYIIETKSRAGGVFESDRMQLAAYAYLLRVESSAPLAAHGYIRFTGGEQSFAKVKLKPDEAVIEAHRRLVSLKNGKETPRFARQAAICQGCGHRDRCAQPKLS